MSSTERLTTPAGTTDRRPHRTAAIAGLVWLAAGIGGFTPETPDLATASTDEIRRYVADSTGTLTLNAFSTAVAAVALLAFVAAVVAIMRRHRADTAVTAYVVGAGALTAVQLALFTSIYSAWVFVDDADALGDATVRTLFDLAVVADGFGTVCMVVTCSMVAVIAWLGLRDRFLSRPVALLGLLIAAAELATLVGFALGAGVAAPMYVAIFGWFLWPAVAGVDVALRGRR